MCGCRDEGLLELNGKTYMLSLKVYETVKTDVAYVQDKTVSQIQAKDRILEYAEAGHRLHSSHSSHRSSSHGSGHESHVSHQSHQSGSGHSSHSSSSHSSHSSGSAAHNNTSAAVTMPTYPEVLVPQQTHDTPAMGTLPVPAIPALPDTASVSTNGVATAATVDDNLTQI